jgi:hypothetical protein
MNEAFSYAAHEDGKGTQGRMHVIGDDGFTRCGRLGSNAQGAYVKAREVRPIERCMRPGCKQNWPDYRASGQMRCGHVNTRCFGAGKQCKRRATWVMLGSATASGKNIYRCTAHKMGFSNEWYLLPRHSQSDAAPEPQR